ncbi:MAG: helix-turn-helix domain-containing protein [Rickettsiales bacterium]|jgi:DNA-binding XRE family transcriptional regulator|nr:helix-turn-helix domain-containing protein [Rickettsiales bacterium]
MAQTNKITKAMPSALKSVLTGFGENLKTARKRRGLSARVVAEKIGMDQRTILDAEKGKPTTAVSTYVALLWVYDMLGAFREVANPLKDETGMRLAAARKKKTIKSELDNDF